MDEVREGWREAVEAWREVFFSGLEWPFVALGPFVLWACPRCAALVTNSLDHAGWHAYEQVMWLEAEGADLLPGPVGVIGK